MKTRGQLITLTEQEGFKRMSDVYKTWTVGWPPWLHFLQSPLEGVSESCMALFGGAFILRGAVVSLWSTESTLARKH